MVVLHKSAINQGHLLVSSSVSSLVDDSYNATPSSVDSFINNKHFYWSG